MAKSNKVKRRDMLVMFIGFTTVGLASAFLPAESLLAFDRKTGYGIYQSSLKKHKSKKKALKEAKNLYTMFGGLFLLAGLGFGFNLLIEILANKLKEMDSISEK